MDRLTNINDTQYQAVRTALTSAYPGKDTPLPGTALKLDDDVMWLGCIPLRVCWGYDTPEYFHGYNPDFDVDACAYYEGQYITDRAPADPQETPMPIYPQQAQQKQAAHDKHDPKRALHDLLKRLSPEAQKKVRKLVQEARPELLR